MDTTNALLRDLNDRSYSYTKNVGKLVTSYDVDEDLLYYLVEMGLQTAAEKFIIEAVFSPEVLDRLYQTGVYHSLHHRWEVVRAILNADSETAISLAEIHFPGFLSNQPLIHMKLLLLKLGSLIKKRDTNAALAYCRGPVADLFRPHPECGEEMQKYTLLLIAPHPCVCQNSYLLEQPRLNNVAGDISREIITFVESDYQFHQLIDTIRLYKYSERFTPSAPAPEVSNSI